jgi:SAM-dependent methyltransferase
MFETLEHIKDDVSIIQEFHRILKDDGFLLISVPYAEHVREYDRPVGACRTREGADVCIGEGGSHYRNSYNLDRTKTLLITDGFTIVSWEYLCLPPWLETSIVSFPFKFPLSLLLNHLSKNRLKLNVMAQKVTRKPVSIEKDGCF